MTGSRGMFLKFGIFAAIMVVLTGALFAIFGQYRTGSTNSYSAVFADASSLRPGDSVRVAGIRVGTVHDVTLRDDNTVLVDFDADRDVTLTSGTKVVARYLNLVGDRYLDLVDGPGSTRIQPPGSQIPAERTEPALDLLAGWLASRIDGPVTRSVGDLEVELTRPSETITLARPQNGVTATLTRTDRPDALLPLARRETRDCLAEELRRLDADEIYRDALEGLDKVQYA